MFVLVQSEVTDEGKVGRLLDELDRCGPNAFDSFVKALEETGQHNAVEALSEVMTTHEMSNVAHTARGRYTFPTVQLFSYACSCFHGRHLYLLSHI